MEHRGSARKGKELNKLLLSLVDGYEKGLRKKNKR